MTPPDDTSGDYLESFLHSAFGDMDDSAVLTPERPEEEETPETVGPYPVVGTIGRGGIGIVYRAQDEELGRELAVKVLRRAHAQDPDLRRRFVEEARICSRLQHPGVVPVHEVGRLEDGRPYFSMKVVEGKTLAERLAARSPESSDGRRDLEVFSKICQTMAYCHAHGVVHGDLKPQNVMVGAFGEVQLMDWGFARSPESAADDAPGEKRTRVIGTPAYMAPEQAKGEFTDVTARTDVFGLGAILCEILCGAPPYLAATKSEVCALAAHADQSDARVRLRASGEDPTLVDLALRCMEPSPTDRPTDAAVVADEMARYLDGLEQRARRLEVEAAEARAVAAEERRSRRLTLALTLTVGVAVIASAAILVWIERDRSSRSAAIERGIAAAEERATMLRREASAAPAGEIDTWERARAAALEATRLSRSPDVTVETAARVATLTAEVEAEAARATRDADLLNRLALLRPHMGDDRSDTALDAAYAGILAEAGVALNDLDVEAAATSLRASPIRAALVDALDEWVHHRRRLEGEDGTQWRSLLAVANRADDDAWRREMRDGYESGDVERLRTLAEADVTRHVSPVGLDLLARALLERGDKPAAVALFRRGSRLHPGDFWIHHNLASQLHSMRPRPSDEILRHLHMAVAVRPNDAHARTDLALEFMLQERIGDATRTLEEARRLDPEYGRAAFLHGAALLRESRPFEALAACREADEAGVTAVWPTLVGSLLQTGYVDEAYERVEARLAEQPNDAMAHYSYAAMLADDFRYDEAMEHVERAIALDPRVSAAYAVRAKLLADRGEFADALASLRDGLGRTGEPREPMPGGFRSWEGLFEEYRALAPAIEPLLDGAPLPPTPAAGQAVAEVAFRLGEPRLVLELLENADVIDDDPEPWSAPFLAARAAALVDAEQDAPAARALEHLAKAIDLVEQAIDTRAVEPIISLPTLRKFRMAPELVPLFESHEDSAALHARTEALEAAVRAEGERRARERSGR